VKTQIWCAIATYVLIAIIKKELKLKRFALYLSADSVVSNLSKKPRFHALAASPLKPQITACHPNQLILFENLTGQL